MRRRYFGKTESGFGMIELVVVLSIGAILAGIAVPAYLAWLPDFRLKGAARNLYSDMRRARLDGVKHNLPRRIIFNPNNTPGTYTIVAPGNDGQVGTADDVTVKTVTFGEYGSGVDYGSGNAPGPIGSSYGGGDGDTISFNNNILTFNARGTCNTGYVYLHHRRQTTAYAVGTRITGSVVLLKSSEGGGWAE